MSITIDGGAGITFPDTVQQTNGMTMTGGNPLYYAARAWVNFNGSGTVAIRAAVNVSSITDGGTGNYRVNFTTAMPDANYVTVCTAARNDGNNTNGVLHILEGGVYSTSAVQLLNQASDGANIDADIACVVIFR
jgi:hypothetical protein